MDPLHFNLLVTLRSSGKYGQKVEQLLPMLRVSGHRQLTLPDLENALRGLADKSFVDQYTSPMGSQSWRITGLGDSALKEEGA